MQVKSIRIPDIILEIIKSVRIGDDTNISEKIRLILQSWLLDNNLMKESKKNEAILLSLSDNYTSVMNKVIEKGIFKNKREIIIDALRHFFKNEGYVDFKDFFS
ncbi:MAG: hypothetical protein ACTSVI_11435 [Promethearchaeota archaeon]